MRFRVRQLKQQTTRSFAHDAQISQLQRDLAPFQSEVTDSELKFMIKLDKFRLPEKQAELNETSISLDGYGKLGGYVASTNQG
jgi:hypothetical protein